MNVISDIRYALRSFRRSPMLAVVAMLSMTLGIGANTAIFSLLNQILLRNLPVKDPGRLVVVKGVGPNNGRTWDDGSHTSFSYPLYRDIAAQNRIFSGVLCRFQLPANLTENGATERAQAELVSGNYFDVLGVGAAIGRTLTPDDDRTRGGHPVVVMSWDAFRNRFGGDPSVLNKKIVVNGHPMTVVGVAQRGFRGFQAGSTVDMFVPMAMAAQLAPEWSELEDRQSNWLQLVARLSPGMDRGQAQVALNTFYKPMLEEDLKRLQGRSERFKQQYLKKTLSLLDGGRGHSPLRNEYSQPLIALMAMVGLVLLIACANVANLLLSRAAGRQKEIAIRLSLGATRWRIGTQLLVESLLLSVTGGALGLMAASWASKALIGLLPLSDLTRGFDATLDWRVLGFCALLSLVTGLLFGLAPAFQATRPNVAGTLKDQATAVTAGGGHVTLRKGLVVSQVALSLVLLIGAGLFGRSLQNLCSVETGYKVDHVMTFSLDPSLSTYSNQQVFQAYDRIQRSIAAIPGTRGASMSAMPLLGGSYMGLGLAIPGYQPKDGEDMGTLVNPVGPNFLSTVGLPLINGRDIGEQDLANAPRVVVVNETLARRFFGQESPVGRHLTIQHRGADLDCEIAGVLKDFKHGDIREQKQPFVFMPYQQWERPMAMTFYVRTTGDPASAGAMLTRAVRDVDPNLPVYDLKTLEQQASESIFLDRAIAVLASAFGFLATLLAAVGLYGVMAYSVVRRTREIGIRMALGASTGDVRSMIMRQVLSLVGIGILAAVPVALLLSRYVKSQLYGLTGNDPATIAVAAVVIAAIGALAGYIPAMRAVRINPTVALRYE